MAEFATIARPYAKALFGLAQEHNKIKESYDDLTVLATLMTDSRVSAYMAEPDLGWKKRADCLLALLDGQEIGEYAHNFVYVLSENGRLAALPYILEAYSILMNDATNSQKAIIYSAYELTDAQKTELLQTLEQKFNKSLDAQMAIDPELIGGVKIEIGDQVLDLSVQGQLKTLYSTVTN